MSFPMAARWSRGARGVWMMVLLAALCGAADGLFAGEAPAPGPAAGTTAQDAPAAAPVAAPATPSDRHLPWIQRLWNRIYADLDRRFDVDQFSKAFRYLFDSLLVILLATVVIWLIRRLVQRVNRRMTTLPGASARKRKFDTIGSLVFSTSKYIVYIATLLWILNIWGVDTQSLVVGSAVIGAAIGFGSQGLVQDIITGLSILAEEQLAVGDYVEIAGRSGAVEEVGLRVIKLRDHLGVQHVIFNRTITMVSNFTTGAVQAMVDISLEKMDVAEKAKQVAAKVCRDIAEEVPYFPNVPEVRGVMQSSTGDIFLRISLKVLPQQQAVIEALFVDRLKKAFAVEGINIPAGGVRVIIISDLFTNTLHKIAPTPPTPGADKVYEGSV